MHPALPGQGTLHMHDVTMVDECKQGMPTSNMHVNKSFQMNSFHKLESMCYKSTKVKYDN